MTLHEQRGRFERTLEPFVAWCARKGITPNQVSLVGFALTLLAAGAYYASSPEHWWLLLVGSFLLGWGTTLDSADGVLARKTDQATKLGDYLDHSFDRFSDVALLVALAFSAWAPVWLGLLAIVGTLLTSYMGTQAQAVGVGRNYGGLLGRADRMMLLIVGPVVEAGRVVAGYEVPYVTTVTWLVLAWIAIAGNITVLQRFWAAYRELRAA